MSTAPFNHGTRVIDAGSQSRPLQVATTGLGFVFPSDDADTDAFPPDEPVTFFTHDTATVAKIGNGLGKDIVEAVRAQGIEGQMIAVRVELGETEEATMAALAGSAASQTGIHALGYALGHVGIEPGLVIAPGHSAGRVDGAKNPLASAVETVAKKLKAMAVLDTGGTDSDESIAYRADFSDRFAYLVDPYVRVFSGGDMVIKPASAYAAAMFLKRDFQKGGPYWSPSNQDVGGILGLARPISYFDGEIAHEANQLNEQGIATFIPARLQQGVGGSFAANGRILWGNRTTSTDPLWQFVNVVRTRAAIEKTIARGFRWANDDNISPQHVIAVLRSLQSFGDELKAVGAVLGFRAWFEGDMNTTAALRNGTLRVEFDAEEAPPLEDLIFGSRRNEAYLDGLVADIQRMASVSFTTTISEAMV